MRRKILLLLILGLATYVRFYNFPQRINFGPEQADSLITAANYLDKPSLLGQSYFARTTSQGHQLFTSPLFDYSLVPFLLLFNYDPLPITAWFTLLNLLTGVLIFLLANRLLGTKIAFFSLTLFLFNNHMINHSLFIWILNYLPLVGLLTLFCLYRFTQKNQAKLAWWLGVLTGIGIGLEFLYLPTAVLVFCFLLWQSKAKLKHGLIFVGGGLLANLPLLIFELRHQFYLTGRLWQYALDTFKNPAQGNLTVYHFFQFFPLLSILGGWLFSRILRFSKPAATVILVGYLFINLTSAKTSFSSAVGMSNDFNYPLLAQAAQKIAQQNPQNFNFASLVPSDTVRSYPLRYLLAFRYHLTPLGIEEYSGLNRLFVIGPPNYNFNQANVWEIYASAPWTSKIIQPLSSSYQLYELKKEGD